MAARAEVAATEDGATGAEASGTGAAAGLGSLGVCGLGSGTAESRAITWAGVSSRPRKSPAKYGMKRLSTVPANSKTEPTKPTSRLGTKAAAVETKKKASAKEATTDPNWSVDSEPMRTFVAGASRRAAKSAVTIVGNTMPRPRKNRLPAFQRLNRPKKMGSSEATSRMMVAAKTVRSRSVNGPSTAWLVVPGFAPAGFCIPFAEPPPGVLPGPASGARPNFWPKLCWFILYSLAWRHRDGSVPKLCRPKRRQRPGPAVIHRIRQLRRKSQFNLSLVNRMADH
ncbi:hypothetical protein AHiyo4_42450 [Arthrobacter sp. Hiyo4]|nr:hypothetical protein AHiyo4_42450 [Arthrobacter sp. Hiyo4]